MKINKKYLLKKDGKFYCDLNGKLDFRSLNVLTARIIEGYTEAQRLQKIFNCEIVLCAIHTFADAKEFILQLLNLLGGGFHPDDSFESYTDHQGNNLFSKDECIELESYMSDAIDFFETMKVDLYEFCLNNLPQLPMQIEAPAPEIQNEYKTVKTNLDYNFYLFCQLRQQFLPSDTEYDIQFNLDIENYNLFLNTFNDPNKDLYTCITNFFTFQPVENKPAKNTLQSIQAKFDAINKEYIKQLFELLKDLRECDEIVNDNAINHIQYDIDYIEVNYFMETPDGDRQHECKLGYQISDADTIQILTTRINNSL